MTKTRNSYQLHIQLCETKPAVWRRLIVADSMTLAQLHRAIQAVMGWQNRHSYIFEIAGQQYGQPNADMPEDPTMDARRYSLGQLLQGQTLAVRYVYNMNTNWVHRIKLEAIARIGSAEALHSLPMCIGGRNACPPEDCAGVTAFNEWVTALQNPDQPEGLRTAYQHLPADFDAKHFDLQRAQARIRSLALLRATAPMAIKSETVSG